MCQLERKTRKSTRTRDTMLNAHGCRNNLNAHGCRSNLNAHGCRSNLVLPRTGKSHDCAG